MINERDRAKKPSETSLQWQMRVMQMDADERDRSGPIVTPEAERHAKYDERLVMHVETMTLARTRRNTSQNSIELMFNKGSIDKDQYEAAMQIRGAIELIESDVSVRGASLEARVDNSGSAKGLLYERLAIVCAEMTYTQWRAKLPMPKALVIDMIRNDQPMFNTARSHKMGWPKARKRLFNALDEWIRIRDKVWATVDESDVSAVQMRIGGGHVS